MTQLELRGCHTRPLLSYLKALGVLRLIAREDPSARLAWRIEGHAFLRTELEEEQLTTYFLERYVPTPIISPWNGGSGFFQNDKGAREPLEAIEASDDPRFKALRRTIAAARALNLELFGAGGPLTPEMKMRLEKEKGLKQELLERWRAAAPEEALVWIDAAFVLSDGDGPSYNPLLGSGGNDGRLDFSAKFLTRLTECLIPRDETERHRSADRLRFGLFDQGQPALGSDRVGMFDPAGAGLPNSSSSGSEVSIINPWDFVLMLEGAVLFGGGVARSLNAQHAVFPFTVSRASRVGAALGAGADASLRGETWLPVWDRLASAASVARLFCEGRLQDGRQAASTGLTVARAVKDAGVDRGLRSFERVVYAERNGNSFIATSVGSLESGRLDSLSLVRSVDGWVRRTRRVGGQAIDASVSTLERIESEIGASADEARSLELWLLALASLERAVARCITSHADSPSPLNNLAAGISQALPDETEVRLARSLAATHEAQLQPGLVRSFRSLVEPVAYRGGRAVWDKAPPGGLHSLERPLKLLAASAALLERTAPVAARGARIVDVEAFLRGKVDDRRIVELAFALCLCKPSSAWHLVGSTASGIDRLYAAARLATAPSQEAAGRSPQVLSLLMAGRGSAAAREAARRLRVNGLRPQAELVAIERSATASLRIAAALAFPLDLAVSAELESLVCLPKREPDNEGDIE